MLACALVLIFLPTGCGSSGLTVCHVALSPPEAAQTHLEAQHQCVTESSALVLFCCRGCNSQCPSTFAREMHVRWVGITSRLTNASCHPAYTTQGRVLRSLICCLCSSTDWLQPFEPPWAESDDNRQCASPADACKPGRVCRWLRKPPIIRSFPKRPFRTAGRQLGRRRCVCEPDGAESVQQCHEGLPAGVMGRIQLCFPRAAGAVQQFPFGESAEVVVGKQQVASVDTAAAGQ